MSFRKEKKYKLTSSDMQILKSTLFAKGMEDLFPARRVKSCYFDSNNFKMFHDSDEGILPRKKIRIRSYNNECLYTLETKISSEEGRYKTSKRIENSFSSNLYPNIIDKDYGLLKPTLLISYSREYFSLKNLRITFDQNIIYKSIRPHKVVKFRDPEFVMEVKTPNYIEDDYIFSVINLATSRFSKYCRGMALINKKIS